MSDSSPRFSPDTLRLFELAEEAMKVAVAEAIAEHRRAGRPVYVWKDGRIQQLESLKDEIDRRYREAYAAHTVIDGELD